MLGSCKEEKITRPNSWYILMTLVTLKKAMPTAAKEKT